jgi:two-component system, OmpR family, sensor histidine kinase BaeS
VQDAKRLWRKYEVAFGVKIGEVMIFRPRLVHTLFTLLFSAVLIAVLSMGSLIAWNLRNGFAELLVAGDVDQLDRFTSFVSREIEPSDVFDAFLAGRLDMRSLIVRFTGAQGPQIRPPVDMRPEGGPPPAPPGAEAIAERVAIFGVDLNRLAGRPFPPDAEGSLDRPLLRGGQTVGWVRMLNRKIPPDGVQTKFLRAQYFGIAGVSFCLLMLSIACAWWVARRWAEPLLAVQAASARIAKGDFTFRHPANQLNEQRTDEIGDVVRNVNQMALALHASETSRQRWIANVSHELRTPLCILQGEIEALVDGVRPANAESFVSLKEEVDHLSQLVGDLHILALSDIKALPCNFVEFDAAQMIRKIIGRFHSRLLSRELCLSFEVETSDWLVRWDSTRIEQVLVNLLENSIRYTQSPGRLMITLGRRLDWVEISIEDSAPGVSSAALFNLFEPLYRADISRDRSVESHQSGLGGSGLGLSICAAIVRAHSGEISAHDSLLGGLRVSLRLPISCQGLK